MVEKSDSKAETKDAKIEKLDSRAHKSNYKTNEITSKVGSEKQILKLSNL